MLEVINAGSTELSRTGADNSLILNCWEKSSPLIKELERTVNFAERKCGDLMQQLNFYKQYYEKWSHTERVNNFYQKKRIKKYCRQTFENGSASENEFEKVNHYLYKKIKNKITEMNNEIAEANRKIHYKKENMALAPNAEPMSKSGVETPEVGEKGDEEKQNSVPNLIENKTSKSEPMVAMSEKVSQPSCDTGQFEKGEIKVSGKQSSKSVPARSKNPKKRDFIPIKRRFSNLQRFKIRSKSLPQGVRRKFGFGGFIEVFDPRMTDNENGNSHSKSKTSLKTESCKSWKSRKRDGKTKAKPVESIRGHTFRVKRNSPKSSRSLQFRFSNPKMDIKPQTQNIRNYASKDTKSESAMSRSIDKTNRPRNTTFHDFCLKPEDSTSCKTVVPSSGNTGGIPPMNNLSVLISKPNALIPFVRNPIPFIPCSSTSKSFNLGLNVQQVLSLIKHKRHSMTLQAIVKSSIQAARSVTNKPEPTLNTLFFSQTTTRHSHMTSALCPAREGSEDTFSILTGNIGSISKCTFLKQAQTDRSRGFEERKMDNFIERDAESKLEEQIEIRKLERPEDVWVVEPSDNTSGNFKKVRTRCTCFPSKHCVDYHKVLRQYTGWKLCGPKTGHLTSDTYSSIACQKSRLYPIPSQDNVRRALGENDGRIDMIKVQNDLINLNRKYSSLQDQITQNNLDDSEANAELDAMESEVALREVEFKDILNFYNQLMELKERLKSLRTKTGSSVNQSTIHQPQYQRPKKDPFRPTPSMALTKVLRKIQGLQDKIKLINAP